MYGLFNGGPRDPAGGGVPAGWVLTALMESVGTAGLAAAAGLPGLLAEVDQHAAAVRESLLAARSAVNEAALAGYAEGVREAAGSHGWLPPVTPFDWAEPDWVVTRLLAVCVLAGDPAARDRAAWAAFALAGDPSPAGDRPATD
nr:DUF6401 family natural product biosynthesis protein [Micromonospora sp. DSM 115978]